MTDVGRMSVGELVGKVLADEHADVMRQAVVWLAQELTETEVTAAAGAGYGERKGRTKPDALRCLKRRISDRGLPDPAAPIPCRLLT
jgi:hypothetical protein